VAHATRFIGREADLFRLEELFRQSQRLITLWGPAGIGKTRLAMRYAELRRAERAAVVWGELASARTVSDVCAAVAAALGLPTAMGVPELGRTLGNWGRVLVVLDNADLATAAVGQALAAWLGDAAEARFLVTSRERVRAAGELCYELLPLPRSEAIDLFADRARLVRPDFKVSVGNRALIEELVDCLERTPLAIELAAARADALGVEGILRRLAERLDVLSVRGAIEWSWELLDRTERAALAQSSVFVGGFSVDAAEAVLELPEPERAVLDVIFALRDKSLLRTTPVGESVRIGHYESIRAYAEEALADSGADAVAAAASRHTSYYLEQAGAWPLPELVADTQNLLAVHARALAAGAVKDALRAALVLDRALAVRGPTETHLSVLAETLALTGDGAGAEAEPALTLAVRRARGNARRLCGDLDGAEADLAAVAVAAEGEVGAAAGADLGVVFHQRRDMSEARRLYEDALARARAARARAVEARVLGNLAALDHDRGAFAEAERQYRQALAIFSDLGDRRHEGVFLGNLAILEQECGREDDARTHFRAGLAILERAGDQRLVGVLIGNLAALEHTAGNLEEARSCYERALELLQAAGELRSEGLCRGRLAAVVATLGDLEGARSQLDVAQRLLERVDDPVGFEAAALARAFIDLTEANRERAGGHMDRAAELLRRVTGRIDGARHGEPSLIEQSDDARGLVRILERALAQLDGASPADALLIGPEARWFRGPGGEWHDLSKRRPLRLILLHLTELRRAAPGRSVDVDALQRAGWPGEKMNPSAGANRVYVTLNKLRKLGLEGVLIRDDLGYLLDPAVPLERISADWRALRATK
jgi:predicted ATPase